MEPHPGYLLATAGEQPSKDKKREAWCRTLANLSSGLESMPSNSRVLENRPYQHLQQLGHNRRTLFRMKLLSGAHLRSCTCVSLRQGEPNRGTSSWIRPTQSGAAKRQEQETCGMVPYSRESRLRAGEHALQQSCAREQPTPTSTTGSARAADTCPYMLSSGVHLRSCPCISP